MEQKSPISTLKRLFRQFYYYCLAGVVGLILSTVLIALLTEKFNVYYMASAVFAYLVAITVSFFMNFFWTFQNSGEKRKKYSLYLIINLFILFLDIVVLFALTEYIGIWYLGSQVIAYAGSGALNFVLEKRLTFHA